MASSRVSYGLGKIRDDLLEVMSKDKRISQALAAAAKKKKVPEKDLKEDIAETVAAKIQDLKFSKENVVDGKEYSHATGQYSSTNTDKLKDKYNIQSIMSKEMMSLAMKKFMKSTKNSKEDNRSEKYKLGIHLLKIILVSIQKEFDLFSALELLSSE